MTKGYSSKVAVIVLAVMTSCSVVLAKDACPWKKGGTRIAGGTDAVRGQWPYQAYIVGEQVCGGTLVSRNYVLTAAHCVTPEGSKTALPAATFKVRLDSIEAHSEGELHDVRAVVVHTGFNATTWQNDIALLQLTEPSRVAPVKLEGANETLSMTTGLEGKILGWGLENPNDISTPSMLKEASVQAIPSTSCSVPPQFAPVFAEKGAIDATRTCAHGDGKDTCRGDSGGPLLVRNARGDYVQIGITSFGVKACGKTAAPGVYTRVAAYASFLSQNLATAQQPASASPLVTASTTLPARRVTLASAGSAISADAVQAPRTTIWVDGKPEMPIIVIPGVVTASSRDTADYVWDVAATTVRKRSFPFYVADGVTDLTRLSGVITKWHMLPALQALQNRSPLVFRIASASNRTIFKDGEPVTPMIAPLADASLRYLTIFDVTSEGSIDFLFPLEQDGGESGGAWDPRAGMSLGETNAKCPFGADHVVAIATAEPPRALRHRLKDLAQRMQNYPVSYPAVTAVQSALEGKPYALGIANLYTAP